MQPVALPKWWNLQSHWFPQLRMPLSARWDPLLPVHRGRHFGKIPFQHPKAPVMTDSILQPCDVPVKLFLGKWAAGDEWSQGRDTWKCFSKETKLLIWLGHLIIFYCSSSVVNEIFFLEQYCPLKAVAPSLQLDDESNGCATQLLPSKCFNFLKNIQIYQIISDLSRVAKTVAPDWNRTMAADSQCQWRVLEMK